MDCSANASLDFEGRGGEELALEISNCLSIAYSSSNAFDLKSLCILPKHQCWKLFVVRNLISVRRSIMIFNEIL